MVEHVYGYGCQQNRKFNRKPKLRAAYRLCKDHTSAEIELIGKKTNRKRKMWYWDQEMHSNGKDAFQKLGKSVQKSQNANKDK